MIGSMRQRVRLQQPVETTALDGGQSIVWEDVETVWAHIKPLSSGQRLYAMGLANPITHRVQMRYRSDIQPKWRLVYEGRIFGIAGIIDSTEKKDHIELTVVEGVPA